LPGLNPLDRTAHPQIATLYLNTGKRGVESHQQKVVNPIKPFRP